MILPALTEATSPFWRPIKYSLFPPLGLATLAAYLDPDVEISLQDEHVEKLDLNDNADLVVIQVYITNAYRAYRIADNQIPLNAEWDPALLKIELTDLKIEEYPLDYTGFSNIGLVSFMSGVNDPNAWSGMPQFTPQESGWFRSITVHFKTKADVNKFAKKLGLKITDDTKTVYLPKPERKDLAAKQYAARA
jgi:hypothetical protein